MIHLCDSHWAVSVSCVDCVYSRILHESRFCSIPSYTDTKLRHPYSNPVICHHTTLTYIRLVLVISACLVKQLYTA